MKSNNRLAGLFMAFLVFSSGFIGFIGSAPVASADIGVQGDCKDDVVGLVTGTEVTLYSNAIDPCFLNNDEITDVDTEEEAKRQIAQSALEDRRHFVRYTDQFDQFSDRIEGPAYLDAKTAYVDSLKNGSTEVEAVTDAREAVHTRTAAQERSLWLQYHSMMDSMTNHEANAEDNQVGETLLIGNVPTGGSADWNYTLVNYSEVGATTNVTLSDGSKIEVPAPYKTNENGTVVDKLHPLDDSPAVAVYSPESGENKTVVNNLTEFGAKNIGTLSMGGSYEYPSSTSTVKKVEFTLSSSSNTAEKIVFDGQNFQIRHGVSSNGDTLAIYEDGGSVDTNHLDTDTTVNVVLSRNDDRTITVTADGQVVGTTTGDHPMKSINLGTYGAANGNTGELQNVVVTPETTRYAFENEFWSKHNALETADDNVIEALGDENEGYLNDVHNNVDLGNLNYSDMYTPYERYRMGVETSDVGEQSWLAFQYASLGYGGANVSDTVTVKIHSGAEVDGTTISEPVTVSGQLFTDAQPPSGAWNASQNYTVDAGGSGADLLSTVYVMHTTTTSTTENGTITYETTGESAEITSGTIEIVEIQDADGNNVDTVAHTDRDPQNTDTSQLTAEIAELRQTLETLRDRIDEDNDGSQEDGGAAVGDGSGDGFVFDLGNLGSFELPFSSASVSFAALGIVGVFGVLLLSQFAWIPRLLAGMFGGKR